MRPHMTGRLAEPSARRRSSISYEMSDGHDHDDHQVISDIFTMLGGPVMMMISITSGPTAPFAVRQLAAIPGILRRFPSSSATIGSRKALQASSSRRVSSTVDQSTAAETMFQTWRLTIASGASVRFRV